MQQFDALPANRETADPFESNGGLIDLPEASVGSPQAVANMLEGCRDYLLLIANAEVPGEIRPKVAASDLVQQSMTDAWQAIDQFRGQNRYELRGWLRCILLNNLRDAVRRYCHTDKRDTTREISLPEASRPEFAGAFTATDPSPSAVAMASEDLALLHAALARLPEHYRQIIRLHSLQHLTFSEIGALIHLETDLTRKLWQRAVKRLAKELRQRP